MESRARRPRQRVFQPARPGRTRSDRKGHARELMLRSREENLNEGDRVRQDRRPEVLTLGDIPKPPPRPGYVLIKVHAIGINLRRRPLPAGTLRREANLPDRRGWRRPASSKRSATGRPDSSPRSRHRIHGEVYAEYCQRPRRWVVKLPDAGDLASAAFPVQVLTAYHMLHTVDSTGPARSSSCTPPPAASGSRGAAREGAGARVFGTVSSDEKKALAKRAAPTPSQLHGANFADEVLKLTEGRGRTSFSTPSGSPPSGRAQVPGAVRHYPLRARGGPPDRERRHASAKSTKVSGFSMRLSPAASRTRRATARSAASRSCALAS